MSNDTDYPLCAGSGNLDDVFLPKTDLEYYPVSREYYTPLDALDIKKTSQSWISLLYCDSVKGHGKSFRFYMWRMNKKESKWKPTLCNLPADDNITMPNNLQRMLKFIGKYRKE